MTPDQAAAYIHAQAVAAQAEILGMHWQNVKREHSMKEPAYNEAHFKEVIEKYGIHHNAILTTFENAS